MTANNRLNLRHRAVRKAQKGRLFLQGPTGAGKTWSALEMATEMVKTGLEPGDVPGPIVVIDTERDSATLYADSFEFDSIPWEPPYDPRELARTLNDIGDSAAAVIIDSGSHFWTGEGGTLDIADGKFTGWKVATPAQSDLVDAILRAPFHVVFCARSKMEHVQEVNEHGKTVVRKVGMAAVQRGDLEYEFTVSADIDLDHIVSISKTRCPLLADHRFKPGHAGEVGQTLGTWLAAGKPLARRSVIDDLICRMNGIGDDESRKGCKQAFVSAFGKPDALLEDDAEKADALVAEWEDKAPEVVDVPVGDEPDGSEPFELAEP